VVLAFADSVLAKGGSLLSKIFAGDEREMVAACTARFSKVKRLKPDASRKRSREFYLLCLGFNGVV
jgi:23S rRNA U2552 (ribose-2'-O)-methylase RlmE/FtsJ